MIIVWFRKDLRLSDNEVLWQACQDANCVLPIYCFDPREYSTTPLLKLPKTDYYRTNFIIQSVENLKQNLQKKEANLLVSCEKPEEVISKLIAEHPSISAVYTQAEIASEEVNVQKAVEQELQKYGVTIKYFENASLFKQKDLPFVIKQMPDVFTIFKNKIEKHCSVRKVFNEPENFKVPELTDWGTLPSLEQLKTKTNIPSVKAFMKWEGGETFAQERLQNYFFNEQHLKTYKLTRNELLGANYSSKFSTWLAQGCISVVQIYQEVKRYESEYLANESTYWLIYELLWREFFRWSALKFGNKIFRASGLATTERTWKQDLKLFEKWKKGETGEPFIDANLRELNETGFMSNRGRQNVASYFCKHLGLDWRWGAEYFESVLIDYDVYSNWGNWAYQAGVGHDLRDRVFNICRQAEMYDPKGEYVNYWLEKTNEQLDFFKN